MQNIFSKYLYTYENPFWKKGEKQSMKPQPNQNSSVTLFWVASHQLRNAALVPFSEGIVKCSSFTVVPEKGSYVDKASHRHWYLPTPSDITHTHTHSATVHHEPVRLPLCPQWHQGLWRKSRAELCTLFIQIFVLLLPLPIIKCDQSFYQHINLQS